MNEFKEKPYTTITEFLDDILKAAQVASKEAIEAEKQKGKPVEQKQYFKEEPVVKSKPNNVPDGALKPSPGNITIDNDDHFILNEMVGGWPTCHELHLIFEQFTEEGYKVPGITDSQLLSVLYHRFRNDPKKLTLIRQLMN